MQATGVWPSSSAAPGTESESALPPVRSDERHLVVRNLERAEDIAADAMAEGIERSNAADRANADEGDMEAELADHDALHTQRSGRPAGSRSR